MRITTGLYKSRIIKFPHNIRPTQDKVRKGLFDILQFNIAGSNFLELFAGSGAVGIEALSNGAQEVCFVEIDKHCCKMIEQNLTKLGLILKEQGIGKNVFIINIETLRAIEMFCKNNRKFDIIFLDPPYYKDFAPRFRSGSTTTAISESLTKKTLQKLSAYDILAPHGLIVVEHNKKDFLNEVIDSLTRFKQKRYGDKHLSFYKRSNK